MPHLLNWLYEIVTRVLIALHAVFSPVFGESSGVTWGLSVLFLTVLVRILLFPLFVKQVKSQRAMQELAPKIKELQTKYKNDRERLGTEMMALYREHGVNPYMGCLPILAQAPVFYALFHVLRYVADHGGNKIPAGFHPEYGWTISLLQSAGHAKVFGVPLALGFRTADRAAFFGAEQLTVQIVTVIAIVVMATTTFLTQRQLIVKNAAAGNPMAQQQKMLLYILPPLFALFGINFQMGVLIYWVTSNIWSLGQQHYIIRSMPLKGPASAPGTAARKPAANAQAPQVIIRRQQTTRPPRSKRSGRRPQRPGSSR
ncbi:MAG: membrane protein insertase YidC [Acidothermus sp.]|nr:membrane protein insertase YidC [Acidothermus sp.]